MCDIAFIPLLMYTQLQFLRVVPPVVGQRCQCVRLVRSLLILYISAELAEVMYAPKRDLKWYINEQIQ